MGKLRVLQYLAPNAVGGIETMVRTLISHLPPHEVDTLVAAMVPQEGSGSQWLEALETQGVPHVTIPPSRNPWRDATKLTEITARWNPDIVHAHGYRADILGAMARLPRGSRRVATLHGFSPTDWKSRWHSRLDRLALRRFDLVMAVAPTIVERLRQSGVRPDRIRLVLNGVDLPKAVDGQASARSELGDPPPAVVLGTVGRLSLEKGHADLLHAFATLKDLPRSIHLVLVGDGPCRPQLENLSHRLGIERSVHFVGERHDVSVWYESFDVFVLSSHTEGCPAVLIEALGFGLPIIATRVGAIPDMMEEGVEGLLVLPRNREQLAAALRRMVEGQDRWPRYGQAARRRYEAEFTATAWVDRVLQAYGNVTQRQPTRQAARS